MDSGVVHVVVATPLTLVVTCDGYTGTGLVVSASHCASDKPDPHTMGVTITLPVAEAVLILPLPEVAVSVRMLDSRDPPISKPFPFGILTVA